MSTLKATQHRLLFDDGTERVVTQKQVHLWRAEVMAGRAHTGPGDIPPNLLILALMWAADTGGTGSVEDFESWSETLVTWTREGDDADPPAQAPDASPT